MRFKTLFSVLMFLLFTAMAHKEASAQGGYYRPRRVYHCPPPQPAYCAPAPAVYCAPPPPPAYYGRRYYRPHRYAYTYRPHYRHGGYRRCR